MKNRCREKTADISGAFFAILLCYLIYSIVEKSLPHILSDYHGHLYVYYPLFSKEFWVEGWQTVPYFMWHAVVYVLENVCHIPLETAAGYASCIFALFSYYVIRWTLQKILIRINGCETPGMASALAFGLSIVQGIYIDWIDVNGRYLGIFSMNPLHNPTQMCVLGISILCLVLTYDIFGRQRADDYKGVFFRVEEGIRKYYILLAAFLFLSALAKPTFAEMFIPAVGSIMLGRLGCYIINKSNRVRAYFKHCLRMFFCAIPALLYILLQYVDYFVMGGSYSGEASVIFTKCGEVWSLFTENIVLSIALGMAFPLYVFLLNPTFFFKNDLGKLGIVSYVIGLLEALFLAESGVKFAHANFMWPMCSGMTMMWIVSLMDMLMLEKQVTVGKKRILLHIGWFLFAIHIVCGYLYIKEIIG